MTYGAVTWIFATAIPLSLLVGFGLGANDVGNMFGPSVGAKALTMKQALLVAAVFEFLGAVLMGAGVTTTIRSGITNLSYFTNAPDVLAYGMLCSLGATGLWMMLATKWEFPVSSTQAIVASIAGMAIASNGWDAVVWSAEKDQFPFLKGMSSIALSWLFAPILAGGFSALLFFLIRILVLRSSNAYKRSLFLLPLFTFATFFVITYFIMAKAGLQFDWQKTSDGKKAWISAIVASGTCLISIFVGVPLVRKKVEADMAAEDKAAVVAMPEKDVSEEGKSEGHSDEEAGCAQATPGDGQPAKASATPAVLQTLRESRIWKTLAHGMSQDIHQVVETNQRVGQLHANSEQFDHKAETSFKYLQVFTACANAFAHGSNEVANSVGPLAAIYQIWQDSAVSSTATVDTWLLAVGGAAIVLGLACYGYKVMQALGVKLMRLSNSRGFCVEICVAAVVILASRFDLPMSSTPATVGAIAGVGLMEGRRSFDWRLFLKFAAGWAITIVVACATSMAFMAQGVYSPNMTWVDQRSSVGSYLNSTSAQIASYLNTTGTAIGNTTWVEQAQAITANIAANITSPILDLIPPKDVQAQALGFLAEDAAALAYAA